MAEQIVILSALAFNLERCDQISERMLAPTLVLALFTLTNGLNLNLAVESAGEDVSVFDIIDI